MGPQHSVESSLRNNLYTWTHCFKRSYGQWFRGSSEHPAVIWECRQRGQRKCAYVEPWPLLTSVAGGWCMCICHIGSIYILGPHLTKDFSQGTEPSMDKLAPRRNMRNVISKIQQHDFLTSLRDSRMGLWWMADSVPPLNNLICC